MTKNEIKKFLDNTKVYVNGKSDLIQKKLFSLGYNWLENNNYEVLFTEKPFLFINDDGEITHSDNMNYFKYQKFKEITAEQILSLELTESCRPFLNQEECWREMHKHQPFGWIYRGSKYCQILVVGNVGIRLADLFLTFDQAVDDTFADGTPFGIKE